jgi:hypothetical protein
MRPTRPALALFALGLTLLLAGSSASAQPLDRTPEGFLLLGRNAIKEKDFKVLTPGPGCNIGVNNLGGTFRNNDAGFSMAPMTQLAADDCTAAGGTVAQCFCNTGGHFNVPCDPFPGPILADETDATFIAACNKLPGGDFPTPCTAGGPDVTVDKASDCVPPGVDDVLGNGVCDLKPGSYGTVDVNRKGAITFIGGVYNLNKYSGDRDTIVTVSVLSTVNVCGNDDLRFGDSGVINSGCGLFRLNYAGTGEVNLGVRKTGDISMHVCAPFGNINLRRNNSIEGNFFGNSENADFNNVGKCCSLNDVCNPGCIPAP